MKSGEVSAGTPTQLTSNYLMEICENVLFLFLTDLYISPAERLVVFDLWGLGSPARLMSEGG